MRSRVKGKRELDIESGLGADWEGAAVRTENVHTIVARIDTSESVRMRQGLESIGHLTSFSVLRLLSELAVKRAACEVRYFVVWGKATRYFKHLPLQIYHHRDAYAGALEGLAKYDKG